MGVLVRSEDYPAKLYRFRSKKDHFVEEIERAASTIPLVFFACMDQFSGSFELKPRLAPATPAQWIAHLRWIFDGGQAHLYARYVDDYLLNSIITRGLDCFDDLPLELVPRLVDSLRRFGLDAFGKRRRDYAAICLIKSIDSRKMWEHYGGNGDGIALEFGVKNPTDEMAAYLGRPLAFNAQFDDVSLFQMRYVDDQPLVDDLEVFRELIDDPDDGKLMANRVLHASGALAGLSLFERQFSFKNAAYSSEEEWRLLRHVGAGSSGYYSAEPLKLLRVVLGERVDERLKRQIIGVCQRSSIPVDRIELSFGNTHNFSQLFAPQQ